MGRLSADYPLILMTPSSIRGPLGEAVSVYFADVALAANMLPNGVSGVGSRL